MKLSREAIENTGLPNSRIGRIGSTARRSTSTKITSAPIDPANMAMITGEVQAYRLPAQETARLRPEAPRATNSTPR